MAPVLSKEAILVGSVDQLCLACESYFRDEREALRHVGTAGHSARLATTHYLQQYRHDRIRKVKKWYLCEFCNVLLTTITKVRLHIEEIKHKENARTIERIGDVIVLGNVVITEETWHGLIDNNTCIICNVEFENKDEHRSESSHVINLIESKVSYDCDNIYRKIDDSTFHCLTCNKVVAKIIAHFDETEHKELLQKSVENVEQQGLVSQNSTQSGNDEDYIDTNNNPNKVLICNELNNWSGETIVVESKADVQDSNENIAKDIKNNRSEVLDLIPKLQLEGIEINFESDTAMCRKCSMNLEFNTKTIENHIEEHNNNTRMKSSESKLILSEINTSNETTQDRTLTMSPACSNHEHEDTVNEENKQLETTKQGETDKKTIQKTAEAHGLMYYSKGNKVFCKTCYKNIPSSCKNIKEHVNGEAHKNKIKLRNRPTNSKGVAVAQKTVDKKCNLSRVPTSRFVTIITTIEHLLFGHDVVINAKYCVTALSFALLSVIDAGRLRCQVCAVNILEDMKQHLSSAEHSRAVDEAPVIIRTDCEFIREVNSGLFHCGYCNLVDSWEGMENHLKSIDHIESKMFAMWRLHTYLPQIRDHHRTVRQLHNDFLMRLLS